LIAFVQQGASSVDCLAKFGKRKAASSNDNAARLRFIAFFG
jgi:hypothetical protein